jgi:hypothetical protein
LRFFGTDIALIFGERRFQMKIVVSLFLVVLIFSPVLAADNDCEAAFTRCGADALITAVISGPGAGIVYATGCFLGYTWCLKYYDTE